MRVANIAAHMGGGVGSVLKDYFRLSNPDVAVNDLFCLDRCVDNFHKIENVGIKLDGLGFEDCQNFSERLLNYDCVVLHYWNHPLTTKFLATVTIPNSRLVVWSHNSGLFEPHILPERLVELANKVLFTSRCSLLAPNLKRHIEDEPSKFGVVHSTRQLDEFLSIGYAREYGKSTKKLLYVGTVSFEKMNPNVVDILVALSLKGFSIRVVGGPDHAEISKQVSARGCDIDFLGPVSCVNQYYQDADIFIYPLRPDHYGTGEQVILEAMAAGLPVVAFMNPAESVIVSKDVGALVRSVEDFVEAVSEISKNSTLYRIMSESCVYKAKTDYCARDMANSFCHHLLDVMRQEKTLHQTYVQDRLVLDELEVYALFSFFDGDMLARQMHENPVNSLAMFMLKIKEYMKDSITAQRWLGNNKSTPFQYQRYFPDSVSLQMINTKLRELEKNYFPRSLSSIYENLGGDCPFLVDKTQQKGACK